MPLANISESENEYLIKIELPDVKKEDVKIAVADGIITISGERKLEREDKAETKKSDIMLKPRVAASDVKRKIEDALKRSAELDASRISVEAMSSKVTLRGSVRSWAERTEAERAA